MDLPPLMQTTPGFTPKKFTKLPLGDEGELSPGPDDLNPYNSIDEREAVEEYKERLRKQRTSTPQLVQIPIDDPTEGDDPYVFDDIGTVVDDFQMPGLVNDGPQF